MVPWLAPDSKSRVQNGGEKQQVGVARTRKDAIKRYNAEGCAGLKERPHTGRPPKLDDAQRAALHDISLAGPDVEKEHLSAYTREDLVGIAKAKWNVSYCATSIGRILREMGLSRQ